MTQKEKDSIHPHLNRIRQMVDLKHVRDWEDQIRDAVRRIETILYTKRGKEKHNRKEVKAR